MYWLFKSEPETFSIDALASRPNQTEPWDGVRNYQARNFMKSAQVGDEVFFYHSNCKEPGIVGIARIVKAAYPDTTAFDSNSPYYDPKSTPEHPRWYRVDVKFVQKFRQIISLSKIKQHPMLNKMQVAKQGNRLSITPVSKEEWNIILKLSN